MAYPDNGNTDPSDRHVFHADKTNRHDHSYHANDLQLGSHRHGTLLHKTLQMLLIQIASGKPVMQLLGTLCKTEQGCHVKRNRRQDRKYDPHRSKSQTETSKDYPNNLQWIFLHLSPFASARDVRLRPKSVRHAKVSLNFLNTCLWCLTPHSAKPPARTSVRPPSSHQAQYHTAPGYSPP